MDLRQGKSGFPDRLLLGAGGSGPMAFIATEILTKAPPDLRLLGHLVSAFHMIHPKYALVSQQNHSSSYFPIDRMFEDYDHFDDQMR